MPTRSNLPIGKVVRKLRHDAGLSQHELAIRAGLHRDSVAKIEQGAHAMNVDTLVCLARVLDVKTSHILRWAELLQERTRERRRLAKQQQAVSA